MALKPRLIAGAWAAAGGVGAVVAYRRLRDFEARAPCLQEAVRSVAASEAGRRALGEGELRLARWPRRVSLDPDTGHARANFELRGSAGSAHVVLAARRQVRAQQAWEDSQEDDEVQLSGWRYYWSRPWELKLGFLGFLQGLRRSRGGEAEEEDPMAGWDLDTLFFLPNGDAHSPIILMGDAMALPEYEAMCLRRDSAVKGEASRRRLRLVSGLAMGGALLAAGLRLRKSVLVSRSYGFVKNSLLAHRDVTTVLGRTPSVQSSSGTFGANYINGRLRLVNTAGAAADVDVAATRDSGAGPWRVVLARMRHAGMSYNLDKSQF